MNDQHTYMCQILLVIELLPLLLLLCPLHQILHMLHFLVQELSRVFVVLPPLHFPKSEKNYMLLNTGKKVTNICKCDTNMCKYISWCLFKFE